MRSWLGFYDHHRQSYASLQLRNPDAAAEFMVGDYRDGGGTGDGGEFMISLRRRSSPVGCAPKPLAVQVTAYADAFGSLRACMDVLDLVAQVEIWAADDLTAILVANGFTDRSDYPSRQVPCSGCQGTGLVPPAPVEGGAQ